MLMRFIVVILTVVLFGASQLNAQASTQQPSQVKATWLWNTWMIVNDASSTLAFLEEKQINKLYLQIDRDVNVNDYARFIENARLKGIQVYALDGASNWVAPNGYKNQDELMNWLTNYQKTVSEAAKFSGVHLDIEPYLYSGWSSDQAATIKSYQTLIQKAKTSTTKLSLPLEVDMPFWFDEVKYKNSFGKGVLADWVIANTNGVTIMAYRDNAQMIIDIVKNEIAMAQKYGKKVVVGVETGVTNEGSIITFAEEGENYMNEQLAKVSAYYQGNSGYSGNAIHHVGSWMTLQQ